MGRFIDNLTLLLIGLKLAGFIDWSWWLVMAPMIVTASTGFWVAFWPKYKKYQNQAKWREAARAKREQSEQE